MVTESQETDLQSLEEDIMSFEDNISQIRLLLLFIDNETLINSIETKINIKNKQMSNNELIKHIQSIKELKDYKHRLSKENAGLLEDSKIYKKQLELLRSSLAKSQKLILQM